MQKFPASASFRTVFTALYPGIYALVFKGENVINDEFEMRPAGDSVAEALYPNFNVDGDTQASVVVYLNKGDIIEHAGNEISVAAVRLGDEL